MNLENDLLLCDVEMTYECERITITTFRGYAKGFCMYFLCISLKVVQKIL